MNYWMVKQEPETYSWDDLVRDKTTVWTGVRNYQARNNLRNMQEGDLVLFYHSVTEKAVVGLALVSRKAYPDPTAEEGDWSCVEIVPKMPLERKVSLAQFKTDTILSASPLIKNSRLSVLPFTREQFIQVLQLGNTKLPRQGN